MEIPPLSPIFPVVKPDRIKKNDQNQAKKYPQANKLLPDEPQEPEPLNHIDTLA